MSDHCPGISHHCISVGVVELPSESRSVVLEVGGNGSIHIRRRLRRIGGGLAVGEDGLVDPLSGVTLDEACALGISCCRHDRHSTLERNSISLVSLVQKTTRIGSGCHTSTTWLWRSELGRMDFEVVLSLAQTNTQKKKTKNGLVVLVLRLGRHLSGMVPLKTVHLAKCRIPVAMRGWRKEIEVA